MIMEPSKSFKDLINDLGYSENETITNLSEEISKLLNAYINSIEGRK